MIYKPEMYYWDGETTHRSLDSSYRQLYYTLFLTNVDKNFNIFCIFLPKNKLKFL